jgi:hypothetical protein
LDPLLRRQVGDVPAASDSRRPLSPSSPAIGGGSSATVRSVPDAIFERQGDLFLPTEATIGPWSREVQHGGPPTMLMARAVEGVEAAQPMRVVRLTVELLRPVPVKPLRVSARLVGGGRRADRVEATLHSDGVEVARTLALRIRSQLLEVPIPEAEAPPSLPEQEIDWGSNAWGASGWAEQSSEGNYGSLGVELRLAGGSVTESGPASVWVRLRRPVVAGEEPSPLMRAAAAADFANGVSWVLDPTRFLFVNPDLNVHLQRQPAGEWICLAARTHLNSDGIGVAEGILYDLQGRIGAALQSLVVEPRG